MKSRNKGSHDEGSDSSEYLPEGEEGFRGGDDAYLDEELLPLRIEPPIQTRRKKLCTKKTKRNANMAPGGRQSKRVRISAPIEIPPGVSTRSSKRQHASQHAEDYVHEDLPPVGENTSHEGVGNEELLGDNDVHRPASPVMDWSYPDDAHHDDVCDRNEEQTKLQTQSRQIDSRDEEPRRRGPRKPRPATREIMLDKMTKSMGRRLPINVVEGKRRPHEPVQAAKFASEAGVVVRAQVPIFSHWKEYKEKENIIHFDDFISAYLLSLCYIHFLYALV